LNTERDQQAECSDAASTRDERFQPVRSRLDRPDRELPKGCRIGMDRRCFRPRTRGKIRLQSKRFATEYFGSVSPVSIAGIEERQKKNQ